MQIPCHARRSGLPVDSTGQSSKRDEPDCTHMSLKRDVNHPNIGRIEVKPLSVELAGDLIDEISLSTK
jgi:hypothetical protein